MISKPTITHSLSNIQHIYFDTHNPQSKIFSPHLETPSSPPPEQEREREAHPHTRMMSGSGLLFSHFLLLFFTIIITSTNQARFVHVKGVMEENGSMVPLIEPGMVGSVVLNETRRRLGSFQICALCTCCGGPKGLCLPSPCCYAINCNIPNRPFGFCSFTPKTCNCFGCHL